LAGFWYYFPDTSRDSVAVGENLRRDFLRSHKLDAVLADVRTVPDQAIVHQAGAGVLVYPLPVSGDVPANVAALERLSWRNVKTDGGTYRLGWDEASSPAPADLERREIVGGYTIKDSYGRPWQVPVMRSPANPRGRLGVSFSWDADDQPRIGVERRYAELWERSAKVWDLVERATVDDVAFLAQSFSAEDDQFLVGYLLDCLGVNYRANNAVWATIDRLSPDWLTQATASIMLDATLDLWKYRAFLDAQKKSAS